MLSLGLPAVAWTFWDDDLDGTGRSPRPFFEVAPSSDVSASFSLELSATACGLSSMPRAILVSEGGVDNSGENDPVTTVLAWELGRVRLQVPRASVVWRGATTKGTRTVALRTTNFNGRRRASKCAVALLSRS